MTREQQVRNIVAFLAILFGESDTWHEEIMKFTPDYLIEKFDRYIRTTSSQSDWGLHRTLRHGVFEPYCDKWKIPISDYIEVE